MEASEKKKPREEMAISASIMHSSCLFRQWKVNSAACASRCTAAQPFRSSHSASRRAQRSSAT